jgi:hypothetical protein
VTEEFFRQICRQEMKETKKMEKTEKSAKNKIKTIRGQSSDARWFVF